MSYYPSNLGYIGFKDGLKTTAHTTVNRFVQYLDENIDVEYDEEVFHEGGESYYAGSKTAVKTQYRGKVNFSAYARPKLTTLLLGALTGKSTFTAATTSIPNIHTLTPKTTDLATTPAQPWLTFEKKLTATQVLKVYGAKLSSITLEGEAGMPVKMSVEGTGLYSKSVTTAQTPTYETDNPFSFYHGTFMVNAPTTSNFDIKSFNIKLMSNNDDAIQTVGLNRQDIIRHTIGAEVTLGLVYTDFVNWKKANYATGAAPTESYSYGSANIDLHYGTGASTRRVQINIPRIKLAPHDTSLNPTPETLSYEMSGIAFKQATTELYTVTAYCSLTTSLPGGI